MVGPGAAAYVTVAPATALPYASRTRTRRGAAKALPSCAVWLLPLTAVMLAGAPAVLVSEKLAVATPPLVVALAAHTV